MKGLRLSCCRHNNKKTTITFCLCLVMQLQSNLARNHLHPFNSHPSYSFDRIAQFLTNFKPFFSDDFLKITIALFSFMVIMENTSLLRN